jgi:DNA-binding LacI/PurR family transcriptional regulator
MTDSEILKTALINAPALARLSGLSVHTVRAIIARKRKRLYPSTRAKMAAALRAHGATLATLADELDRTR